MIFVPIRSRKARGPRQRAATAAAVAVAAVVAGSTLFRRSTRGSGVLWRVPDPPWLFWMLAAAAFAVIAALVVMLVVRSSGGDDTHDEHKQD